MAARASSDSKSSMLYAMVIFIVLFLAAAVWAVVMYMNNEQLRADARDAQERLELLATDQEYRELKPLAATSGVGRKTAVGQLTEDVRDVVAYVVGQEAAAVPLVGARDSVVRTLQPIWEQLPMLFEDPVEAEPGRGLAKIAESLIAALQKWVERATQTGLDMEALREQSEEKIKALESHIEKLNEDLGVASRAAASNETLYSGRFADQSGKYEQIIRQLESQITEAQGSAKTAQEENDTIKRQEVEFQMEVKNLRERLQQFQPSPETETAALEVDGFVILVNPRERIAYINLTNKDHIYRGLTFTVYDSFREIPKSGQGKGSLEVIEIMDTMSKCRIVDADATNPIQAKDIIANLIWSPEKEYLFCVVGEFDFDGDGQIDADGRQRIVTLIEGWGGRVTDTLPVETDFLVLGEAPAVPRQPMEDYGEGLTEEGVRYREALTRTEQYQGVREEAVALGVPTFNLNRFLYFIGYYQQVKSLRG